MLELRHVPYDHPDARLLTARVQAYYRELYGDQDVTPVEPAQFAAPLGAFVVGYADGVPVACGGWRAREGADDPALRDGDAEIKRMYVDPAHRGRGHARGVLAELERSARAAGRLRTVLETGVRQPEAVALYLSSGYRPAPPFGVYRCAPGSRCFAKPMTPGRAVPSSYGFIGSRGE